MMGQLHTTKKGWKAGGVMQRVLEFMCSQLCWKQLCMVIKPVFTLQNFPSPCLPETFHMCIIFSFLSIISILYLLPPCLHLCFYLWVQSHAVLMGGVGAVIVGFRRQVSEGERVGNSKTTKQCYKKKYKIIKSAQAEWVTARTAHQHGNRKQQCK